MARFVHLTDANNAEAIARGGVKPRRGRGGWRAPGVYAMAVLDRYELTFQWAREVKRWGGRSLAAATFVLPDHERVFVGRYNAAPKACRAAAAVAKLHAMDDPRGWEVIVPRAVRAAEIAHVRPLNRIVGWRYFPDAHGRGPCGCPACVSRGEPFAARIRARWRAEQG